MIERVGRPERRFATAEMPHTPAPLSIIQVAGSGTDGAHTPISSVGR
jgi:hypothetical protein